ncbi:hypothetical protein LB553_00960 [Mesorhizobium sp. CA8]|uniref:hypothetical protein n=1 Tax=Mesorhizobium sp. CA8 TaxID=2876637 RepID=UPI001CCFE754|nr:hypothetical protein [Mesorhizobium sp. CA8]MBZ9759457.1 hypothetical protein [Mesorhizobium sp. CA8]
MIFTANTSFPMRVATYTPHRKPAGYLIRIGMRAGGSEDRVSSSPRAGILSISLNLPADPFQSTAWFPLSSVVASLSSLAGVRLAGSFEAQRTPKALSYRPTFSSRDKGHLSRLIRIWADTKSTVGKCFSLLRALVQDANQTASRIFEAFGLTPVQFLSLIALSHGKTMHQRSVRGHGKSLRKHG